MDKDLLAKYEKIGEQTFAAHLTAYTEHSKWILASLLTLNGGALIVFAQIVGTIPDARRSLAPICFVMGALIAILSGIAARKQTSGVSETFLAFLVADNDDARSTALKAGSKKDNYLKRIADFAAFASAASFLAGSIFTWAATYRS